MHRFLSLETTTDDEPVSLVFVQAFHQSLMNSFQKTAKSLKNGKHGSKVPWKGKWTNWL